MKEIGDRHDPPVEIGQRLDKAGPYHRCTVHLPVADIAGDVVLKIELGRSRLDDIFVGADIDMRAEYPRATVDIDFPGGDPAVNGDTDDNRREDDVDIDFPGGDPAVISGVNARRSGGEVVVPSQQIDKALIDIDVGVTPCHAFVVGESVSPETVGSRLRRTQGVHAPDAVSSVEADNVVHDDRGGRERRVGLHRDAAGGIELRDDIQDNRVVDNGHTGAVQENARCGVGGVVADYVVAQRRRTVDKVDAAARTAVIPCQHVRSDQGGTPAVDSSSRGVRGVILDDTKLQNDVGTIRNIDAAAGACRVVLYIVAGKDRLEQVIPPPSEPLLPWMTSLMIVGEAFWQLMPLLEPFWTMKPSSRVLEFTPEATTVPALLPSRMVRSTDQLRCDREVSMPVKPP